MINEKKQKTKKIDTSSDEYALAIFRFYREKARNKGDSLNSLKIKVLKEKREQEENRNTKRTILEKEIQPSEHQKQLLLEIGDDNAWIIIPSPGIGYRQEEKRYNKFDPKPANLLIQKMVENPVWKSRFVLMDLANKWEEIVGKEVAEHCEVEGLREGKLFLRASSTSWMTQIKLLQNNLKTQLDNSLGQDVVKEIQILGPAAPSWKHGIYSVKGGRGPRDTYG